MSQIKYVHVIEEEDGNRLISAGKGDRSGTFVSVRDDGSDWERWSWERVGFWKLPDPMPKSEFKDWWNENKDTRQEPIPEILDAMERSVGPDTDQQEGSQ